MDTKVTAIEKSVFTTEAKTCCTESLTVSHKMQAAMMTAEQVHKTNAMVGKGRMLEAWKQQEVQR